VLDYNDYNQPGLYSADAYRSSEHDLAIMGLSLGEKPSYQGHLPRGIHYRHRPSGAGGQRVLTACQFSMR